MKILNSASPTYVAKVLHDAGFRGKIDDSEGYYTVDTATEGWTICVRFIGKLTGPDDTADTLQLWSCFAVSTDDLSAVKDMCNEINFEYRFGKAFVSQEGDAFFAQLTLDHWCPEGITDEIICGLISVFTDVRRRFYFACQDKTKAENASETLPAEGVLEFSGKPC